MMTIEPLKVTVAELIDGYRDSDEEGVVGYHGKLDIRPKYQREFVYNEKQEKAVIDTISKGFPLSTMYWVEKEDGTYEVMDGQQRTLSICRYCWGAYAVNWKGNLWAFSNLPEAEREQLLNYELEVKVCKGGTDVEKLDWFQVINIAGEELTAQEIRNAVYAGSWVTDAKRHFSRSNSAAKRMSDGYISKKWIRQEGLEMAISWVAKRDGMSIEEYMRRHQHDSDCSDLWLYFNTVVTWAKMKFIGKHSNLYTATDWGEMYRKHKDDEIDAKKLEAWISDLLKDGEITNKKGVLWYVLDNNEQHLGLRAFDEKTALEVYEAQGHKCVGGPNCPEHGRELAFEEMEADHIVPWSKGGLTVKENCQMLCRHCNRTKSNK
jgi:5-methylcytosine-specific restriction endonuclease McrA